MSRKIEDLVPEMQVKAREFAGRMAEAGIPFIFTCTRRSRAEQEELYARGRTKPGKKVTWTLKSKHIVRLMQWERKKSGLPPLGRKRERSDCAPNI